MGRVQTLCIYRAQLCTKFEFLRPRANLVQSSSLSLHVQLHVHFLCSIFACLLHFFARSFTSVDFCVVIGPFYYTFFTRPKTWYLQRTVKILTAVRNAYFQSGIRKSYSNKGSLLYFFGARIFLGCTGYPFIHVMHDRVSDLEVCDHEKDA